MTPAPFIVGVGRSGTTLLRMMLDAHPELAIPPETHFIPKLIELFDGEDDVSPEDALAVMTSERHWGDFGLDADAVLARLRAAGPLDDAADAIRGFFGLYAEREGKPRWGDKTPIYVTSMREIAEVLPEARFIHLIRDGRDVALSRATRALKHPVPIKRVARRWRDRILDAREQSGKLDHYLELRYEDLVQDTEGVLRRVCELLELPFDERMLTYHERAPERLRELGRDLPGDGGKPDRPGSERLAAHTMTTEPPNPERISRWRKQMSEADRAVFEETAGDLLAELGYEIDTSRRRKIRVRRLRGPARKLRRAIGRRAARLRRPAADRPPPPDELPYPPAPFVVGVTRSGTTLLRMMLDAHPELAIPPETHFIPDLIEACRERDATPESALQAVAGNRRWGDFNLDADELLERLRAIDRLNPGDALRAFFALYAEREGKPRWGDKTPIYINRMSLIQRALPEARFIHLIRDGRDAALSRARRALKEQAPTDKVAARWKNRILRAREQAPRLNAYLEIRYEDLVTDTEETLRRVCELIELPFDEGMLTYYERAGERLQEMTRDLPPRPGKPLRPADHRAEAHRLTSRPPDPSRLGRWRQEMSPEDRETFATVAGDLLSELGYEVDAPVGARSTGS